MRKICVVIVMVYIAVFMTGCPKGTPARPEVIAGAAEYEIAQLNANIADYECATVGSRTVVKDSAENSGRQTIQSSQTVCGTNSIDLAKARRIRDTTIYRLIRVTDYNYFQFENDLYIKRATASTLADIVDTSANFAATITNGERAKTIINAAIIAFRGGRKSVNLNFFREQTGEILITKMQTSRNRVLREMLVQLKDKDIDEYPLDAALGDAIRYFYAGTLPRALQELQQDTSVQAKEAKQEILVLKGIAPTPPPSETEAEDALRAYDILEDLTKSLDKPDKKAAALEKLQKIIKELQADKRTAKLLEKEDLGDLKDGKKLRNAINNVRRAADDIGASGISIFIEQKIIKVSKEEK